MSTNKHFVKVIADEIKCYGSVNFLATGSIQDQHYFVKLYPNNIILYDKKYNLQNRSRSSTLEDAVVELYVLSNTHHIYGYYGSWFSRLASTFS